MSSSFSSSFFFWKTKIPLDNAWHPVPGGKPTEYANHPPQRTLDLEATAIDAAPFIFFSGALAHLAQLPHFHFTAHFSPFRNPRTLAALHLATLAFPPIVLACQATGLEYRYFVPRWAHERERRRDEAEVRKHVDVGLAVGAMAWVGRMGFRLGTRYWAPVEVLFGGAGLDLLLREFGRAHGL